MNLAYHHEIHSRLFAPCTNLETLCKDIPSDMFAPFEYASNNGYYGIDFALKSYAGLPTSYQLKAHYSHIPILFEGCAWIQDYNLLPMLFTWAPSHEQVYKKVCRKPMYSIGPTIHYAQNAYTDEMIASEKKRLGRNALFFPTHSTHHIPVKFSVDETLSLLEPYKKHFDTIRISVYWKDYLDEWHKPFLDSGYECVTAGHIFDPYFLSRAKALMSVTDHTFGNAFGGNIAFSIYMNIPHTHLQQEIYKDFSSDPGQTSLSSGAQMRDREIQNFLNYFSTYSSKITPVQYKLCNHYFGYDCVRTRDDLLKLLHASEELFCATVLKNAK